jgi:hypothetical protein
MRMQLPISWHSAAPQQSVAWHGTAQHGAAQRNPAHPVSPGDAHLIVQEDDVKACRAQLLGGLHSVEAVRAAAEDASRVSIDSF